MLEAAASGDRSYSPPGRRLELMFASFSAAMARLDRLGERLAQLEQSAGRERALARAKEWLPEDADLTAEAHFIMDGASGGYVLGKRIGMDLLQFSGQLDQLEGVIAHELHHVGFASLARPAGSSGTREGGEAGASGMAP